MYQIYIDEAGTSANEPVSVVVGVIIKADSQWKIAADAVSNLIDKRVPDSLKRGFIFHAKDIWNGSSFRGQWSKNDRIDFIAEFLQIPRIINAGLCLGKVRRDSLVPEIGGLMAKSQFQHMMAFTYCVASADKYVRDWGDESELATVVAEDVEKMRKFLKKTIPIIKNENIFGDVTPGSILPMKIEKQTGLLLQNSPGQAERIVDTVHFVGKNEAPLVQIADACAFAFRRYFAGQEHGESWVEAMLGEKLDWEDWQGPASRMNWNFNVESFSFNAI